MAEISEKLTKLESEQVEIEKQYSRLALTIPNLIHESVPIGGDDSFNKEIKKWGEIPKFDFKINDHIDISESLDLVDLERAAKVADAYLVFPFSKFISLDNKISSFLIKFY